MTGDALRQEREKQNLTIKDIEKGTSIRALYIESIEKGEFDKLPGEAYTKGFIRSYANFLKLDANALVKQYMQENNPEKLAAQEQVKADEEKARAAQQTVEREAPQPRQPAPQPRQPAPRRKQSYGSSFSTGADFEQRVNAAHRRQNMLLALVVVIVVGAGAFFLLSSDDQQAPAPQAPKTQQAAKPAPQEQAPAAAPEKKSEGVEVRAEFSNRCWTSVKADGKTIYEGTIEKGKSMEWKADDKMVITFGDAGAASVTVNGKDMGKVGKTGQVEEKTFTKDN
ncbi:MAG: DUF4115 domain-containing protein [Selenomonas sp.]|nr:DUF4115 domain-containing protein [Selenomonas sp.]